MKEGWEERPLGEITQEIRGSAELACGSMYQLWSVPSFTSGMPEVVDGASVKSAKRRVAEGDVLLCKINPRINRVWVVGTGGGLPQIASTEWITLRPKNRSAVSAAYLQRYLSSPVFRRWITADTKGATGSHTRAKPAEVLKQIIPVPPLHEQRRIVAILDEAFEGIAAAKANAERNELAAADLFHSQSWAVFDRLGKSHEWRTLSQLIDSGWVQGHLDGNHGSDYPRKEEFVGRGVPYISANCIDADAVVMSRCKFLSPQRAAKLRKGIARSRDVLFAHNATVGPVAILETSEPKVILGTSLTYYRCDEAKIIPEYLALFMRSAGFVTQYEQVMRQSTRNQVPITKQREFRHVIPSLSEQRQVVATLGELSSAVRKSRSNYNQKLTALDELKASLLHQAFTGNL